LITKDKVKSCIFFFVIICLTFSQMLGFEQNSLAMGGIQQPTAIVVDVNTGEPIEGAVAIAIWRKHSMTARAWWEGGTTVVARVEEAVSDKEGKLYIDDFWDWHLFESRYPHLTIYKPGYVCWDQEFIYIKEYKWERRNDFNKEARIVRMKAWPEGFSFVGHSRFVSSCTRRDTLEATEKLFRKAFNYERKFRIDERTEIDKARKEKKQKKKGDNHD
jgi:hypothetical protein